MRLVTSIADMKEVSRQVHVAGKSLALVPTMGALHDGHLSLVRQARRQCDTVVVSIFVNPIQFVAGEDFSGYPRNLEQDLELLRPFKVDVAFAPKVTELYSPAFDTFVEPGKIALPLEGASRPGHFRGVATVVLKLLNIVKPDIAYFGQKDLQQALVVRRLIEDLNLDLRQVVCPTVRDREGLACSSRNATLSEEERRAALVLYRSLRRAEEVAHHGEAEAGKILAEMQAVIQAEPLARLDYLAIVEPARLQPIERVVPGSVALAAARVGPARLIDNTIFGPPGASPELLLQLALAAPYFAPASARIPGFETETLRLRIDQCRDCAAVSSVLIPPREFMVKYLKRDYPDLNAVQVLVIGRDSPINPANFLYHDPALRHRFAEGLYELLGVKSFEEFKFRFALTDALRCHATGSRAPEKAMAYCARHLRDEFALFPALEAVVVLGEDAYLQFQHHILGRKEREFKPFSELLQEKGWSAEEVELPGHGLRRVRVLYCYHPTFGYKRSPSIASVLKSETPSGQDIAR